MAKPRDLLDKLFKPFLPAAQTRATHDDRDLQTLAAKEQRAIPYSALASATRNFSDRNKLGEGGFGPVYRGTLKDGRLVAVKRLSVGSRQGEREFKNEALLLSRVQHRNIVNLYGYCATAGDGAAQPEKLLVYEYIPHESLDKILYDEEKRRDLNWTRRFDIINGVARGLLYLHEDCHTPIIHRDIKASNILLDEKWVPKIADFGMARLYPEQQTHVQTRIAGTNGYMPPEYLMNGQLSTKADVYSFGVLILELVTGVKNSTFFMHADADSLLEWVWKLHRKGRSLEVVDEMLKDMGSEEQILSCIHIGLLCTQADPKLRPDMGRVVVMLSKKPGSNLPEPTRPGFMGSRSEKSSGSGRTTSNRIFTSGSGRTTSTKTSNSSRASTSGSKSSHVSSYDSNIRPSYTADVAKSSRETYQERIKMLKSV